MRLKPLHNVVVIKPFIVDQTASGLIIEGTTNNKGIVMAAGPKAVSVSGGDVVFYSQYVENTITEDGEQYILMPEDQIFLIIEQKDGNEQAEN
jgi:co-chaperonin GroES (HSP10)